jgi:tetratricopeptide (TPR) repeat protein
MEPNSNGMMHKYNLKIVGAVFLCFFLAACSGGQIKNDDETTKVDILEINKLADAAYASGDMEESEKHYSVLIREIPKEVLPWFRLANVYARTKRPDPAVRAYKEVLVRNPAYANAWFNMAIVQLKQAASSFNEMQIYTDSTHPLYPRSKQAFEGILELIKGDVADE